MQVRMDKTGPVTLESRADLARRIEDTRLVFPAGIDPEQAIRDLCADAKREWFRAVCVRPQHVALAKDLLAGTSVKIATVIAFPAAKLSLQDEKERATLGDIPWEDKVAEMEQARDDGADEFDVVMNLRQFREWSTTVPETPSQYELAQLVAHAQGCPIKLIIETDLLGDEEIVKAVHHAMAVGIEFIKTSTGMLIDGQGATSRNVHLIYKAIQDFTMEHKPLIKASGGIRNASDALALIQAGADIIGTSCGTAILNDFQSGDGSRFFK